VPVVLVVSADGRSTEVAMAYSFGRGVEEPVVMVFSV
jgi:hypothetical protein